MGDVAETQSRPVKKYAKLCKVTDRGLVYGWAITCSVGGEPYYDLQGDHIPEAVMLDAAIDFMKSARTAKEMHVGKSKGTVLFAVPWDIDAAEAFGYKDAPVTGLMVVAQFQDEEILKKFRDGTYTGFSIGGELLDADDLTDEDEKE